jgi:hypothetical protein
MQYEFRACPMCGEQMVIPPGRIPSIMTWNLEGERTRCQVTVDGKVKHRCQRTR